MKAISPLNVSFRTPVKPVAVHRPALLQPAGCTSTPRFGSEAASIGGKKFLWGMGAGAVALLIGIGMVVDDPPGGTGSTLVPSKPATSSVVAPDAQNAQKAATEALMEADKAQRIADQAQIAAAKTTTSADDLKANEAQKAAIAAHKAAAEAQLIATQAKHDDDDDNVQLAAAQLAAEAAKKAAADAEAAKKAAEEAAKKPTPSYGGYGN